MEIKMGNAVHVRNESLLGIQAEREKEFLSVFNNGNYTPEKPLVVVNPYAICPCSALVMFKTKEETAVTLTVCGKESCADISHTFSKAKNHILPVLGLYPDFCNTVNITLYQGAEYTIKIKTEKGEAEPAKLLSIDTSFEYLGNDLIFVSPAANPDRLTGFDLNGDVRWYTTILLKMGIKKLANGRILVGGDRTIAFPYYAASIYEMDFLGKIYNEYIIPGGYHHDQFEMPDGDLLVLTQGEECPTVEDVCVLIDRKTGRIKKTWDYKAVITPGDGGSGLRTEEDWFHNNAVWYDANTNSLSLSGRHIDAIVNLDYESGQVNWILGDPEGWSEDKQGLFFKPVSDKPFQWQYAQHAVSVLPCGDILCFDNGTKRSKSKEKYLLNKDNYSRAVRYRINKDEMTIEQVWEFGRDLGSGFFSQHICNAEYYGKAHYLIHSGGIQHIDGVPAENILIGDAPNFKRESITICVVNGVKTLEMHVERNYYRAARLPLYNSSYSFSTGEGRTLGSFNETKKDEIPSFKEEGKAVSADSLVHVIEYPEYIEFMARFRPEKNAYLVLRQGEQAGFYRLISGERSAFMGCMPYIEGNPDNIRKLVKKAGLLGTYDVAVIIDGEMFNTGVAISC
jgi:arylsulfate sulfotransferase